MKESFKETRPARTLRHLGRVVVVQVIRLGAEHKQSHLPVLSLVSLEMPKQEKTMKGGAFILIVLCGPGQAELELTCLSR